MFTVTFEGLCGFSSGGDAQQTTVFMPHTMPMARAEGTSQTAAGHHTTLLAKMTDFDWMSPMQPDMLFTVPGGEEFLLWQLSGRFSAQGDGTGKPEWNAGFDKVINLAAAHPKASHATLRSEDDGTALALRGGSLHPNAMSTEELILSYVNRPSPPYAADFFVQSVDWQSVNSTLVIRQDKGKIAFKENAHVTVTNALPDMDAIGDDHFGGYYTLFELASDDRLGRLMLQRPTMAPRAIPHPGTEGNCSNIAILP